MNYITEAEKKMVAENYRKVVTEVNKKYIDLYPAMDALDSLYVKIYELRPDLGYNHAYTFESDGTIKHYTCRAFDTDGCFGYILFDKENGITLCLGKSKAYFNQYKRARKESFVFSCCDFDKMMRGEHFNSQEIISSYKYYKNLSDQFTLAALRLDDVAKAMTKFINVLEDLNREEQRKIVDFFKGASELTTSVVKRLKITVEEVEELN